jgi:hypothetical protein
MIPKTIRPMPLSSGSIYAASMIAAYYGHPAAETQARTAVRTNPTGLIYWFVGWDHRPNRIVVELSELTVVNLCQGAAGYRPGIGDHETPPVEHHQVPVVATSGPSVAP